MKIWIYPPCPEPLLNALYEKYPDFKIIVGAEPVADAEIVVGNPPLCTLQDNSHLRLLQLRSAGTADYPSLLSKENAPALCCATGAYGHAVAEHMLSALMCLMKRLNGYAVNRLKGLWTDLGPASTIHGANVLVLGLGNIGGEFGEMCRALGAHVIGFNRTQTPNPEAAHEIYTLDRLDEFLPGADVIAMALPDTPSTQNIMNKSRFQKVKKGAYLVNAGRGSAIDEDALLQALSDGTLAQASLDVTRTEPLDKSHPLWRAENLLITPHVSGGDHLPDIAEKLTEITLANINALIRRTPFTSLVDASTGYRRR